MVWVGTIVIGLALLLGALNGLRRGAIKEGMALIGVLLGALLVSSWAERWGLLVARRTSWQPGTGHWLAAIGLLWGTALLAGYGSGVLLPRRDVRLPVALRATGALLGLLNGGLLAAFTLRYTQSWFYGETAALQRTSWIRNDVVSRFILDRFDLILLGLAWTIAAASLIVTLVRLVGGLMTSSRSVPAAPATSSAPARPTAATPPSSSTTAQRPLAPGMEPSFIEKPREGNREQGTGNRG